MIIDCVSDLHGSFPILEGGDLLLLAGDYTVRDTIPDWHKFFEWLNKQDYRKKVMIGGNHDKFLEQCLSSKEDEDVGLVDGDDPDDYEYLKDSGCEFEGLKIWGSPWSRWFDGVNDKCDAFMLKSEAELGEKWALIPDDTDILVTHSPPFGMLDDLDSCYEDREITNVGSLHLAYRTVDLDLKLHVFGHIHEAHGMRKVGDSYFVNASIMNQYYSPVNKPIRIIL
jgi:Icc-related predicted phosphoesterase